MKKVYIILLTLMFIQFNNLFSENWEPFPLNQTSYYKITSFNYPHPINFFEDTDLLGSIGIITFDSINVINENKNKKEYFSKRYNKLKNDKCLLSIIDSLKTNSYDLTEIIPDYYSIIDDTIYIKSIYYESNDDFTLKLPLNLAFGDSIVQTSYDSVYTYSVSLHIKLLSKIATTTFGVMDSLLTFGIERRRNPKPVDEVFEISLSKNFGILSMPPLTLLYSFPISFKIKKLELVAVDANQEHYGEVYDFKYRNRNLLEKTGNVNICYNFWQDMGYLDFYYMRDSIMGVDITDEYVYVGYNRKILSSNQGLNPDSDYNDSYVYYTRDSIINPGYNAMVDALKRGETFIPSTEFFNKVPNEETEYKYDSLEVIATPLLFKFVDICGQKDLQIFYSKQATFDRDNCNLAFQTRVYNIFDYKLNSWRVNIFYVGGSTHEYYIGLKDGDCEWGDLSWPPKGLSVSNDIVENLYIYPNPAQDVLNLTNIPDGAIDFEIINQYGVSQLMGFISEQIDVSQLPAGIYFLKLNSQTTPIKFIKI